MSYLTKKNLGSCHFAKQWTEYPGMGKKWRDNWDATFGTADPQDSKEPDSKHSKVQTPRPGSPESEELGCTCPILDNHHGQGFPYVEGRTCYYITEGCPLHSYQDEE